MTDWHDKGELPPVGEAVLIPDGERWEVVAHRGSAAIVISKDDEVELYHHEHLKPLKSKQDQEREDFINTFLRDSDIAPSHTHHNLVRAILRNVFDAGYRKVKPLSFEQYRQSVSDNSFSQESMYNALVRNGHIVSEGE